MRNRDLQHIVVCTSMCQEDPLPKPGRVTVAAVVTNEKGRILSIGTNSYTKTHPLQKHYAEGEEEESRVFLHAEIAALVKVRDGKPDTIYVGRLKRNGSYGLSRPCPICMRAIREAGIRRVVYTTNNGIQDEWI